ncbi:Uncharacterised protein [Serratia odorifera]|uniref:Uncharacterized protein n=1 Tax=Serratia odorifera TaxID=618 RepID=A0A3S4DRN3_SEROD|nr:Uncharacterised protein [Serratia odorifera]
MHVIRFWIILYRLYRLHHRDIVDSLFLTQQQQGLRRGTFMRLEFVLQERSCQG